MQIVLMNLVFHMLERSSLITWQANIFCNFVNLNWRCTKCNWVCLLSFRKHVLIWIQLVADNVI